MRCLCSSASTSSFGAFSRTVMSRSCGVMTVDTGASSFVSKRRSRCVTMPTALEPTTTGTPEMFFARVSSSTSRIVLSGEIVIGSWITPLSNFLTRCTSRAWASMLMFLWTMPMPPSCAIVIARRASVTVSMAADRIGRLRRIVRVSCVLRSASRGRKSEYAGTRSTSSKVSASSRMRMAWNPRLSMKARHCTANEAAAAVSLLSSIAAALATWSLGFLGACARRRRPARDRATSTRPSRLNREARTLLERGLPALWLEGEISNLSRPSSGHWYFSLKDEAAQLRCAMFRQRNLLARFTPRDGCTCWCAVA